MRASPLELSDWLEGRARSLPAIDATAMLKKCVARRETMIAPRGGANPAKRSSSGAQQVSQVNGGVARAPLPPTSIGELNKQIDSLNSQRKMLDAKKQKLLAEERKQVAAKKKSAAATNRRSSRR